MVLAGPGSCPRVFPIRLPRGQAVTRSEIRGQWQRYRQSCELVRHALVRCGEIADPRRLQRLQQFLRRQRPVFSAPFVTVGCGIMVQFRARDSANDVPGAICGRLACHRTTCNRAVVDNDPRPKVQVSAASRAALPDATGSAIIFPATSVRSHATPARAKHATTDTSPVQTALLRTAFGRAEIP